MCVVVLFPSPSGRGPTHSRIERGVRENVEIKIKSTTSLTPRAILPLVGPLPGGEGNVQQNDHAPEVKKVYNF